MFFCPHERKASKMPGWDPEIDPEYWAEHPCGCYVCFPQYVVLAVVVTAIGFVGATGRGVRYLYNKAIRRNQEPKDDDLYE
jgi:hypothetical protein